MTFSTPANKDKPQVCQCGCFIVPPVVLRQYSRDANLDPNLRGNLQDTFAETMRLRTLREASRVAAVTRRPGAPAAAAAAPAQVQQQLFDCQNRQSLPGRPVANPQEAPRRDAVRVVYDTTAKVAEFYSQVLGRNSIDNQGIDLVSSLHYRRNFDNAFWNGQQMVYGDGDGQLFAEFWQSPDVIGHELTHGVTQYESGLRYEGESGALNESISDVFGAVFNQWLNQWPASEPKGWLVGAGIMGARSKANGKTCLRDMLDPGANHCLSPQPDTYDNFDPTADVHENSGIPNKAFATFAQSLGGNSWDQAIKVWYAACTSRQLSTGATFADFARLTIQETFNRGGSDMERLAQQAWEAVHLPLASV